MSFAIQVANANTVLYFYNRMCGKAWKSWFIFDISVNTSLFIKLLYCAVGCYVMSVNQEHLKPHLNCLVFLHEWIIYHGCLPQSRFAQVRSSAVLWGGKWVILRLNYLFYLKPKCWLYQVSLKWWEGLTLMSSVLGLYTAEPSWKSHWSALS